jgi:hypothetical protein
MSFISKIEIPLKWRITIFIKETKILKHHIKLSTMFCIDKLTQI